MIRSRCLSIVCVAGDGKSNVSFAAWPRCFFKQASSVPEVYQPSPRPYTGLPDIDYPFHDRTIVVTRCGRICLGRKKINFSQVFAGQAVGIKEVDDGIWLVTFMDYDLGYIDLEEKTLQPLNNPFGPKV